MQILSMIDWIFGRHKHPSKIVNAWIAIIIDCANKPIKILESIIKLNPPTNTNTTNPYRIVYTIQ